MQSTMGWERETGPIMFQTYHQKEKKKKLNEVFEARTDVKDHLVEMPVADIN